MKEEVRKEIMAETLADPVLFCRTFLPHWFSLPISWAHRGVLAILLRQTDFLLNFGTERWPSGEFEWTKEDLDRIVSFFVWKQNPEDESEEGVPLFIWEGGTLHLQITQFAQIVWPRGFGKTTMINAATIFKVVFHLRRFMFYVSETATHAEKQLDNVKRELEGNKLLMEVFGVQRPERTEPQAWRADFIETVYGIALAAKGRRGQVRGTLHRNQRPDDITIDDVEDKESVETDAQRMKTRDWFYADVIPALPQVQKDGVINMIGTLLHREALIPTIMGDPDWISIVFGALAPDGLPLWEQYMNLEDIEKRKAAFARAGMLAQFYMEFMSRLMNSEASKFRPPFLYQIMTRTEFVAVAEVIDPAISEDPNADFCALAVTGITDKGRHHVLDIAGDRGLHPSEQIRLFFELHYRWEPTHHGVEAIAYQRALIHFMQEEMFRQAKTHGTIAYFEITPISHGKVGKIARVEGMLAPRYSAGYISHQTTFGKLEQQLLDWPNDKLDFPDAVAMAMTLLDPYAGYAFDPMTMVDGEEVSVDDPLAKDIYEPLDDFGGAP